MAVGKSVEDVYSRLFISSLDEQYSGGIGLAWMMLCTSQAMSCYIKTPKFAPQFKYLNVLAVVESHG